MKVVYKNEREERPKDICCSFTIIIIINNKGHKLPSPPLPPVFFFHFLACAFACKILGKNDELYHNINTQSEGKHLSTASPVFKAQKVSNSIENFLRHSFNLLKFKLSKFFYNFFIHSLIVLIQVIHYQQKKGVLLDRFKELTAPF